MRDRRKVERFAALALAGGCVFQVAGCVTSLGPMLLSYTESAFLSLLFGGL